MADEQSLFRTTLENAGISVDDASILIACLALIVSFSAIVQTAGVRRKEWRLEAVALAAEASARARRCQQLVCELWPTVDAVFSLAGMAGSDLRDSYHRELDRYEKHGKEVKKFTEEQLQALGSMIGARFNLQHRIQESTKTLHDIRGTEETLVAMTSRFTDELMDARNRKNPTRS